MDLPFSSVQRAPSSQIKSELCSVARTPIYLLCQSEAVLLFLYLLIQGSSVRKLCTLAFVYSECVMCLSEYALGGNLPCF